MTRPLTMRGLKIFLENHHVRPSSETNDEASTLNHAKFYDMREDCQKQYGYAVGHLLQNIFVQETTHGQCGYTYIFIPDTWEDVEEHFKERIKTRPSLPPKGRGR